VTDAPLDPEAALGEAANLDGSVPTATASPLSRFPLDRLGPDIRAAVAAATTARLFLSGGPSSYDTASWLRLRADHAAARDAVHSELDLSAPGLADLVARHGPLVVETAAPDASSYLARPDLGRRLSPASARSLAGSAGAADGGRDAAELALVVGDGLSATAVEAHAPQLVDALVEGAATRGWRVWHPVVVVRHCRVGVLNDLGPRLDADIVVLLVGERPGLAAADSLSAYLAYRPRPGQTDADRNLVSGIHDRGTPVREAAGRILDLAGLLLVARRSGVAVKEELAAGGAELAGGVG
jgi:ethanolamine ammonia-lyase small subunit